MIGSNFKFEDNSKRVADAAERASFKNLKHAAARIRLDAQASIEKAPAEAGKKTKSKRNKKAGKKRRKRTKPAPPGHAPYTTRGQLRRAIVFDANKESAFIGPRATIVGTSGEAHEFGGSYKQQDYPERPFMGPALDSNLDRFASSFAGSIGG